MTYQILKNGILVKTIEAKGIESIFNQFNSYAKKRGGNYELRDGVVGAMVWILPNQDVLSLSAV